jgi:hypothetical protein
MNAKDQKNKGLDAAIKNVLLAASVSDAEIDEAVAKPFTYAAIRSRIDAAALEGSKPAKRRIVPVLSFATVLLASFVAGSSYIYESGSEPAPQFVAVPVIEPQSASKSLTDTPQADFRPEMVAAAFKPAKVKTSLRNRSTRKFARPSKKESKRTLSPDLTDTFYALDYHGVADEAVDGGHVVRVKMPRASLFAIGMNVPLENEAASVEADVMVGPDGVPHAIRLVD